MRCKKKRWGSWLIFTGFLSQIVDTLTCAPENDMKPEVSNISIATSSYHEVFNVLLMSDGI